MKLWPPRNRDTDGFKDDETEAYRDMHQLRNELNAKFGCLGYSLLIIGIVIFYLISLIFQ